MWSAVTHLTTCEWFSVPCWFRRRWWHNIVFRSCPQKFPSSAQLLRDCHSIDSRSTRRNKRQLLMKKTLKFDTQFCGIPTRQTAVNRRAVYISWWDVKILSISLFVWDSPRADLTTVRWISFSSWGKGNIEIPSAIVFQWEVLHEDRDSAKELVIQLYTESLGELRSRGGVGKLPDGLIAFVQFRCLTLIEFPYHRLSLIPGKLLIFPGNLNLCADLWCESVNSLVVVGEFSAMSVHLALLSDRRVLTWSVGLFEIGHPRRDESYRTELTTQFVVLVSIGISQI